ncbi:solute carrier family 39 fear-of-intimacy isoform X2 [Leptinotarsa decemlineata]|uniref:solute carrier family 39 fear-of-intimacy isoform X2 n=1 Tax=Leptinotarsa decemlineata TaxID=7539 RepID=UPI003D3089FD
MCMNQKIPVTMSRHVLSVCIFCFICATHSPCASHAATRQENIFRHKNYYDPKNIQAIEQLQITSREKQKFDQVSIGTAHDDKAIELGHPSNRKVKRNSYNSDVNSETEQDYIRKIFMMYGNGEEMTLEGFTKFLADMKLHEVVVKRNDEHDIEHHIDVHVEENSTCSENEDLENLLKADFQMNRSSFYEACPILIYSIINRHCAEEIFLEDETSSTARNGFVWFCSIMAVVLISACGVLSLAIIPVMKKKFYKPMIQFLVALAVGTLAGDALLHLLPHAMSGNHAEERNSHMHGHDDNIKKGCVAMLGLTFFFIMERLILLLGNWRKGKRKHEHSHVTVIKDAGENEKGNNETQCMDRYNSVPYCYEDIMSNPRTLYESDKTSTTTPLDPTPNSDKQSCKISRSADDLEANQNTIESSALSEMNRMLGPTSIDKPNEDYTVIVREHRNDHHGHSHKHGHVHAAPRNFSSVAWMVIMGDGLHNFTDGMAIGAAFSGSLAGGFSTTVAVFCHELPHELGDFAVLLQAGMTIKQALFYNVLSSILCVFGNVFGLVLGNTEYASSWVFAAAAGMFIYIALVDLIPELSSAHEDEGNLMQCVLHLGGLLVGLGIMALIAFYEHSLMNLFNDSF